MSLRTGEKLTWYPSTRRPRIERTQTATVIISLNSCVGKVMERMINSRLVWHLVTNKITP